MKASTSLQHLPNYELRIYARQCIPCRLSRHMLLWSQIGCESPHCALELSNPLRRWPGWEGV